MNRLELDLQCVRRFRRTFALISLLLLVTTAGGFWLMSLLASGWSVPVAAVLAAALVTVLCVPLLWYGTSRLVGIANLPERLRAEALVSHATEAILTINKLGQVLSLNPAGERFFGYRAAEVLHEPITKLLTDPPVRERHNLLHDTLPAGTILGLAAGAREVLGKRKNGETFPIELTGSSMTLDDEPVSVVFARDISKRKRAQRYLTAHYAATCVLAEACSLGEALPRILQAICEALSWEVGVYWRLDADAGVLCGAEVYQSPLVALPQLPDGGSLTCPPAQGLPGRVWSTGKPAWVEDVLNTTDCPCLALAGPLHLHGAFAFPILVGQEVCGAMTFFSKRKQKPDERLLDIMADLAKQLGHFITRKRDEEMLRESETRLRSVTQTANDAIVSADSTGSIIGWNQAAQRIFGYAEEEVIGWPLSVLMPERYRLDHQRGMGRFRSEGASRLPGRTLELHGLNKAGAEFPLELSVAQWETEKGRFFTGIMRDVTERKRLEEQFRQSQKMEAVGRLAGGVAHDFNNLLTVILGYSDFALNDLGPSDPFYPLLEEIKRAGERASALTRQLLAFSRRQVLVPEILNLNVLVEDMEKMLHRLIGEDLELLVSPEAGLWEVKADPGQLEQVVMNLVVNARDAMPRGGKLTLETDNVVLDDSYVKVHPCARPGKHVRLAVSDTGCGMDQATLARIFEPFFSTKGEKGTGLGLSTVYGIVQQSDGHIEVYSEPGHGTTFKIYLPQATPTAQANRSRLGPQAVQRGSETVLLTEDEASLRSLARMILQEYGYTVLEACHGDEALQVCEQYEGPIHLLVTDVVMPHMSGQQLWERLAPLRPEIKVLFLSGYTDDAIVHHGVLNAGTPFLQKPFTPKALARKVREVLDQQEDASFPIPELASSPSG